MTEKTYDVHESVWVGFGQTQNLNHIGFSGLGEVK